MDQERPYLPEPLEELRYERVWTCWRKKKNEDQTKHEYSKRPVSPVTGREDGWQRAENLGSFALAREYQRTTPGIDGVGFLGQALGYLVLDMDNAVKENNNPDDIDPITLQAKPECLTDWANAIVTRLQTYTEISCSGKGLHCIVKVRPETIRALRENPDYATIRSGLRDPDGGTNGELQILVGNYATLSCNQLPGFFDQPIRACDSEIFELAQEMSTEKKKRAPAPSEPPKKPDAPKTESPFTRENWLDQCRGYSNSQIWEYILKSPQMGPGEPEKLENIWNGGDSGDNLSNITDTLLLTLYSFLGGPGGLEDDEIIAIYKESPLWAMESTHHSERWIGRSLNSAKGRVKNHRNGFTFAGKKNAAEFHAAERAQAAKASFEGDQQFMNGLQEPGAGGGEFSVSAENGQKPKKSENGKKEEPNLSDWDLDVDGFDSYVRASHEGGRPVWSTGLSGLDDLLGGGFFEEQLILLGAISSLGKSTLVLQMAASMAEQGKHVIIFSLEMSKRELSGKLISAFMYQDRSPDPEAGDRECATLNDVLDGTVYADDSIAAHYRAALERLRAASSHLHIVEGHNDISVDRISDTVDLFKARYGEPPVVILDYLQILRPSERAMLNGRMITDKRLLVDYDVTTLKVLARDNRVPVIVISAFNRGSYTEPVGMESFKESGGCEYGSDVVLGLQYDGFEYAPDEGETKHKARVRQEMKKYIDRASMGWSVPIDIRLLKCRNGRRGNVIISFVPKYSFYDAGERIEAYDYNKIAEQEKLEKDAKRAAAATRKAERKKAAAKDITTGEEVEVEEIGALDERWTGGTFDHLKGTLVPNPTRGHKKK